MSIALISTTCWRPSRQQALYLCREIVRHFRMTEHELTGRVDFKFTHCPSLGYDPRFQFPPGAQTYGAGFAAAQIGHDITTGRPWGAR